MMEDVVSFEVVDPLRRVDGAIHWEDRDVQVAADGDVAFSHPLSRVTGKLETGAEIDIRTTPGFRRVVGRRIIVHEHRSEPFDPQTGKASLGLRP